MINNHTGSGIEKINLYTLNECIEENRRHMNQTTNYDFLEKLSRLVLQKIKIGNNEGIVPVVLFSREKSIAIVLNFFENIGNKQWYEQAKNIILGQNKNISINIFREEDISDYSDKNEDGLYKYSHISQVEQSQNNHNKAIVKILLDDEFSDVKNNIPKDKFTIKDIYSFVHEISHTLDLGENEEAVQERQLFAELTSYCFENMLTEYLVNNNIINETVRDKIEERGLKNNFRHARTVCAKINLIKLKQKDKVLTKENIKQMLEKEDINNPLYVQSMLQDLLASVPYIDYDARYPIGMLTAHQYIKTYKKDKEQAVENLSKYCESIKKGNSSDDILRLIGCPMNLEEIESVLNDISNDKSR